MYNNDDNHPSPNSNEKLKKGFDDLDLYLRFLKISWESMWEEYVECGMYRGSFANFLIDYRQTMGVFRMPKCKRKKR